MNLNFKSFQTRFCKWRKTTLIIQKYQSQIKKLKAYIIHYVSQVYKPTLKILKELVRTTNLQLEPFFFTVIDKINENIERVRSKINLKTTEFYFDDGLELHIMFKNKSSDEFPIKHLHFEDLETKHKKIIIQILKTEL